MQLTGHQAPFTQQSTQERHSDLHLYFFSVLILIAHGATPSEFAKTPQW